MVRDVESRVGEQIDELGRHSRCVCEYIAPRAAAILAQLGGAEYRQGSEGQRDG